GADPSDLSAAGLDPWFATRSPRVDAAAFPLPTLSSAATGLGHLGFFPDRDGITRDIPLVITYRDTPLPALALVAALRELNLSVDQILPGKMPTMDVGPLKLPMGDNGRLLMRFYPDEGAPVFRTESFYDVFTGIVPAASFRGQTVLIGVTALGTGDALSTPAGNATSPVEVLANAVSTLSQQHYFSRPGYATNFILTLFIALWLYIVFGLPRIGAISGALISLALLAALFFGEAMWLSGYSEWLALVTPALFLVGGHLVMTVRSFGLTERLKLQTDAASAESNRMLGLAFQNQGQLDMAFEKFRRCPLDDSLMEPLYNLALDYERKRQFHKAGAVYMRMAEHDPKYRDIDARLKRNERLDETLVVGAGGSSGAQIFLDDDDSVQKPMLGRYVVEKELGKGAMGTVYLGRDPKINRVVAIKTIALSQEFDENEVASVRERFFREAETAGRLNH
ncbi:MAG: CHASE2 domain-containing protein, partial [Pseudomonadota bacterium]